MAGVGPFAFFHLCLALLCTTVAYAQLQAPIRSFAPSDYGAKRQTWDIAQAPDGTMAFANGAGVLLFDGVNWTLLPTPEGHTIRSVMNHSQSGNWIGGAYDAIYTWTEYSAKFAISTPHKTLPPPGPKEEWWNIVENPTDSSQLFVQTFSRMASIKLNSKDSAEAVKVPGNIMFSAVVNDKVYLPVLEKGLYKLSGKEWQLVSNHPLLRTATVVGITEGDTAGDLILATRDGKIYSFRQNKLTPWPSSQQHTWSSSQLNKLLRLKDGRFAVATIGNGVFILSTEGKVTAHFTKQSGLPDDTVLSLYEDLEGDLWAGLDNGIAHIGLSGGVQFYGRDLGTVYSVYPTDKAHLLIGTNQGLYYSSPFGKNPDQELLSGQVWHIAPTAYGTIVGTNDGTSVLDKQRTLRTIGTLAGGWCWLAIDSVTALAGTYAGIELFSAADGNWVSQGKLSGFDQPVQHLAIDPKHDHQFLANHPQEGLYRIEINLTEKSIKTLGLMQKGPGRLASSSVDPSIAFYTENAAFAINSNGDLIEKAPGTEVFEVLNRSILLKADHLKLWSNQQDTSVLLLAPNLEYPIVTELPTDTVKKGGSAIAVGLTRGIGFIEPSHHKQRYPATKSILAYNNLKARTISFTQARYDEVPLWSVKLDGIDSSYSAFSSRSVYSYPFLPTGEYTLKWRNNSGQSGEIFLGIEPYWYESKFAILLYLLLIGLAIWALRVYYRRRLRIQARKAEIERERQLTAERLQTRAAELEAEVEISKRTVALRDAEVEHRNRELARTTMTLVRQNETLLRLKESLTPLPRTGDVGKAKRQSIRLIEGHLSDDTDWEFFEEHFDAVHAGFLKKLHDQHPDLTPGDLRLAALLRLNLLSKEIAPLLHISIRGVENKRYRLRKKLGLPADVNLTAWVIDFE